MQRGFDRDRSIDELEGVDWGEPTYQSSLVTTCHRLRRKPLNRFTEEDLRIMIGQKISLSYLIPLTIERLEEDPLVEACFFRGDLLAVVLRVEATFWAAQPESFKRFCEIINGVNTMLPSLDDIDASLISRVLAEASDAFERFKGSVDHSPLHGRAWNTVWDRSLVAKTCRSPSANRRRSQVFRKLPGTMPSGSPSLRTVMPFVRRTA